MANKSRLRENRYGTVINGVSSKQELELGAALEDSTEQIIEKFGLKLIHKKRVMLTDIVSDLRKNFADVNFTDPFPSSFMTPDGGLLYIEAKKTGDLYPILITEVKNQGTNDLRVQEGKKRQARGNAIERLGKNVIGFRTMLSVENIMPFVCFGYGCDFEDDSSILDRVKTIAMFGDLNQVSVLPEGGDGVFNRGSFFFRRDPWTKKEMTDVMTEVATRSIHYYYSRYGENFFVTA